MNKEPSIRTRRAAARARERRKRKLMIAGGLVGILLLVILLGIFVFISCGNEKYDAETSTVYVLDDGKIISVSVESFDEKIYDKEEFEEYIKENADAYNSENGEDSVKQNNLEIEDNIAKLTMEYAGAEVFEDFEGIELFSGSILEAQEAGYTFEGTFASILDGKIRECTIEDFMSDSEYKVVVIKANTTVCVDRGKVCYVSTENVDSVTGNYVVIKDGSRLIVTEEDTQQGESVETTEASDGAVGEDELEIGTENEIQFEFGETESEEKSQYSDVYTYIIYK